MSRKRKYHVSGIDEHGDLHTFRTDHRERADEVEQDMREDLQDVERTETKQ